MHADDNTSRHTCDLTSEISAPAMSSQIDAQASTFVVLLHLLRTGASPKEFSDIVGGVPVEHMTKEGPVFAIEKTSETFDEVVVRRDVSGSMRSAYIRYNRCNENCISRENLRKWLSPDWIMIEEVVGRGADRSIYNVDGVTFIFDFSNGLLVGFGRNN